MQEQSGGLIDITLIFTAVYIATSVPYVKDALSGNEAIIREVFSLGSRLGTFGTIAFYIFFMLTGTVANIVYKSYSKCNEDNEFIKQQAATQKQSITADAYPSF